MTNLEHLHEAERLLEEAKLAYQRASNAGVTVTTADVQYVGSLIRLAEVHVEIYKATR